MSRLMGIDYGSARTGIALGDTETRVASPWCVIPSQDELRLLDEISRIVNAELVHTLIVGVPRQPRALDQESDQAKEIRMFIQRLRDRGHVVVEEDETWSTALAARQTREQGQRGKRDDLAATVILQTYLDRER